MMARDAALWLGAFHLVTVPAIVAYVVWRNR